MKNIGESIKYIYIRIYITIQKLNILSEAKENEIELLLFLLESNILFQYTSFLSMPQRERRILLETNYWQFTVEISLHKKLQNIFIRWISKSRRRDKEELLEPLRPNVIKLYILKLKKQIKDRIPLNESLFKVRPRKEFLLFFCFSKYH